MPRDADIPRRFITYVKRCWRLTNPGGAGTRVLGLRRRAMHAGNVGSAFIEGGLTGAFLVPFVVYGPSCVGCIEVL